MNTDQTVFTNDLADADFVIGLTPPHDPAYLMDPGRPWVLYAVLKDPEAPQKVVTVDRYACLPAAQRRVVTILNELGRELEKGV